MSTSGCLEEWPASLISSSWCSLFNGRPRTFMHSSHLRDFSSYNDRRWFGQETSVDPFVVDIQVMCFLLMNTSLITLVVSLSSKILILFAASLNFSSCTVWALYTWRPEDFMAAFRPGFVRWYSGDPTLAFTNLKCLNYWQFLLIHTLLDNYWRLSIFRESLCKLHWRGGDLQLKVAPKQPYTYGGGVLVELLLWKIMSLNNQCPKIKKKINHKFISSQIILP